MALTRKRRRPAAAPVASVALRQTLGYRKFAGETLTVLLLDGQYHLYGECRNALEARGHRTVTINVGYSAAEVVRDLLWGLVEYRPDFVLSINQIGFDQDGTVGQLLEQLQIPVAVWYVDSPFFVLRQSSLPAAAVSTVFAWERTLVDVMRRAGVEDVHYLPLATDPECFRPAGHGIKQSLTFVGDSMTNARKKWQGRLSPAGRKRAKQIANQLLVDRRLDLFGGLRGTMGPQRADILAAATWQATARYRRGVLKTVADAGLQIMGDSAWPALLPTASYGGTVRYGAELAAFYESSKVNLNMTSLQMPTAVNQRVFDVPAAGGFLLTDGQADVYEHFDVGQELIAFEDPAQLPDLVRHYQRHDSERRSIVARGRERVLRDHTYQLRVSKMLQVLRARYG